MVFLGSVQLTRRPRLFAVRAFSLDRDGRRQWAQQMLLAGAMAAGAILAVAGVMLAGVL